MTRRVRLISGAHPARRRRLAGARQAITIIEILAIVIIFAIGLAIAFPMFATRCGGSPKTAQLSNVKQLATSLELYCGDFERFPLGFGRSGPFYAWNQGAFIPLSEEAPVLLVPRVQSSRSSWANSIQPYARNYSILGLPRAPIAEADFFEPRDAQLPFVGVTYNGLLSDISPDAVRSPRRVITFWSGLGKANVRGYAYASPALVCEQAFPAPCEYVPAKEGCSAKENGSTSRLLTPRATMWTFGKGMNVSFADSSAKFRQFGTRDPQQDPFAAYYADGVAAQHWWDGCHPWLFRPDANLEEQP